MTNEQLRDEIKAMMNALNGRMDATNERMDKTDEKLDAHGLTLARLDERVEFLFKTEGKTDSRTTYLERRDLIGNILAGLAAIFLAIHTILTK